MNQTTALLERMRARLYRLDSTDTDDPLFRQAADTIERQAEKIEMQAQRIAMFENAVDYINEMDGDIVEAAFTATSSPSVPPDSQEG